MKTRLIGVLVLLGLCWGAGTAGAAAKYWKPTAVGASLDWTNGMGAANSWDTAGVPTAADNVYIGSSSGQNPLTTCYVGRVNADIAVATNITVGASAGCRGELIINSGSLNFGGVSLASYIGRVNSIGVVQQTGGSVLHSGSAVFHFAEGTNSSGDWLMTGGTFTNSSSVDMKIGNGGKGTMLISGQGTRFARTGAGGFSIPAAAGYGSITVANGGAFEYNNAGAGVLSIAYIGGGYGALVITNGGTVSIGGANGAQAFRLAALANSTGLLYIASGGVFSNSNPGASGLMDIGRSVTASANVVISNGTFHSEGNVKVIAGNATTDPGAMITLYGTQRVWRIGASATNIFGNSTTRFGYLTNHVIRLAGGVDILNTDSGALSIIAPSKIHLSFEELPTTSCNFWGFRWAGTNGYATLTNYFAKGLITWSTNAAGGFTSPVTVYRTNDEFSVTNTYIGMVVTVKDSARKGTVLIIR